MKKDNWKQVIISILVGAGVAFFSTLFQGLADFFKSYATEVVSGVASSGVYLAKAFRG